MLRGDEYVIQLLVYVCDSLGERVENDHYNIIIIIIVMLLVVELKYTRSSEKYRSWSGNLYNVRVRCTIYTHRILSR